MPGISATRTWGPLAGLSLLALFVLSPASWNPHTVIAQANTQGQWRTLGNQVPINPVHVALMNNGEVLIVAGSGNVATETNFRAAVWNPLSETFLTQSLAWDMFCNGMVVLHDGRVFINGGNLRYDPFYGEPRNAVFDPATGMFTDVENMAHGRWYPTTTTLGDGSVMTFSGLLERAARTRRWKSNGGFRLEPGVHRRLDSAAVPAHAPEHGWSSLLRGLDAKSRFFNPSTRRGQRSSRRPTTPAPGATAHRSCCR